MDIQLAVHNQYTICFIFSGLDIAVLVVYIRSVEIDQVAFLICLVGFHQCFIFFKSIIFTIYVFQKGELGTTIIELFVAQHTVLDKQFQAIPFFFELRTVVFKHFFQAVGHFLCDMIGNLFHVLVALQIRTGNVQWNIRRIEYTVQQCQEFRNDTFYGIGYKYLVAV